MAKLIRGPFITCAASSRIILCALGVVASTGCAGGNERNFAAEPSDVRQYQNVTLEALIKNPRGFHEALVRVQGIADLQFEGVSLLPEDGQAGGNADRAVGLHLDWPLPAPVLNFEAHPVIVEARFDADDGGHGGWFPGTLTDVRAIWRPGQEQQAFRPNHQTRSDALEQLEFKTAW